ncbi:hypothetical protein BV22DRAFT_1034853 [Leucogyrophana mollusca]|uniref:Uncharacterized protein n=1 Tax=Leucogyrophana mollusca TaxID=85980 RepID=A0ACB8BGS6_9AGAM|nr:hypothetical protein BV22DRAFT_1034853 [Leucogyrophana mollusca]
MSVPQGHQPSLSQPKVIVHHLNDSRSQRVLWLLVRSDSRFIFRDLMESRVYSQEELEVPYEIKNYSRNADRRAPKELLDVSPLGKSPVITDGDVTLAESGAIVTYLIERYGKDKDQPPASGRLHDLYFTHYSEGSFMPLLVQKLILTIIPQKAPIFISFLLRMVLGQVVKQVLDPELRKHQALIEDHLAKSGTWFAGGEHPTAADYMMAFPLEALVSEEPHFVGPKALAFVNNVQSRPAYKRALDRGGKYTYAKL